MKKKTLAILISILCLCFLLSACGDTTDYSDSGYQKKETDILFSETFIEKGCFAENADVAEIRQAIENGNFTLVFYSGKLMVKFEKDYYAFIKYKLLQEDDSLVTKENWTYEYLIKDNGEEYRVVMETVDGQITSKSASKGWPEELCERLTDMKELLSQINVENYKIENGNLKINAFTFLFTDNNHKMQILDYVCNVGTTTTDIVDECLNWKQWLEN